MVGSENAQSRIDGRRSSLGHQRLESSARGNLTGHALRIIRDLLTFEPEGVDKGSILGAMTGAGGEPGGEPGPPGGDEAAESEADAKARAEAAWRTQLERARKEEEVYREVSERLQLELNDISGGIYNPGRAARLQFLEENKQLLAETQQRVAALEAEGRANGYR